MEIPKQPETATLLTCGIVMPIGDSPECSVQHWAEVLAIIEDSAREAGFSPRLVSHAEHSGVILQRIVQNLYDDSIIVCDVSTNNPNVMFELGIRLAFDKPTIILKDELTDYNFDTSVIEHIPYPRSLNFQSIVEFKKKLSSKIVSTSCYYADNPGDSPFLGHFSKIRATRINTIELPEMEYLEQQFSILKELIQPQKRRKFDDDDPINTMRVALHVTDISENIMHQIADEIRREMPVVMAKLAWSKTRDGAVFLLPAGGSLDMRENAAKVVKQISPQSHVWLSPVSTDMWF